MDNESIEEARGFWNRFDALRGSRTIKDIANAIGIDYELVRVQRTRYRTPKLGLAVNLANELGTTVEYLATGENGGIPFSLVLYNAYMNASDDSRRIVDIALSLDENKNQTKRMSV